MKRIISILVVVAMLFATVLSIIPAAATSTEEATKTTFLTAEALEEIKKSFENPDTASNAFVNGVTPFAFAQEEAQKKFSGNQILDITLPIKQVGTADADGNVKFTISILKLAGVAVASETVATYAVKVPAASLTAGKFATLDLTSYDIVVGADETIVFGSADDTLLPAWVMAESALTAVLKAKAPYVTGIYGYAGKSNAVRQDGNSIFLDVTMVAAEADDEEVPAGPVGTPVATADEFKAAVEAGKDFYLTDSITLPADWAAKDFGATMDGNEKTITLSGTAGLFATLNGATIKNVAVLGEELTDGIAKGATGAVRFENVTSMVKTIKGNNNAAAFVSGQNSPASITFIKCTNMTNVVGGLTGGAFGGWIQAGDLVFEDCANLGNVSAQYAGGYVGAPQNANITVKNSTNGTPEAPVSVKGTSAYAGGMFGESYANVTLTDVVNCANVTGGGGVMGGGIIGGFHKARTFRATNVLNYGAMDVDGAWNKMGGGFVGDADTADSSFYFVDCVNFGTMKQSGNNNGGGFLGGNQNSPLYKIVSFVRCVNYCDVVKGGNIGGFCGQGNAKEYYFEDCVNEGDVISASNMAGAFFGWGGGTCDKVTAIRCTNNGAITAQKSDKPCAGFMAGRGTKVYTFTDCVNNGAITAGTNAAGFATGCGGSVTLTTCVNNGVLTGKTTSEFTDRADQVLINAYLDATPTATTLEGAINVYFNDTTETKDKDWIGLVKEGETSSTAWAYVKDLKTGFNVLDLPVVEGKAITGGYYYIYMVPNDKNLADVLDPESEDKLLADPVKIFLADNIINTPEDLLNTKPGGIYALGADITLPADYVPVDFAASLDGDGHTITLTGKKGLFNKLTNASVKNLIIDAKIDSDGGVGVLATTAEGNVVVDNVTVKGTVKGTEVGGFFQYVNAEGANVTITNSKNNANLTGTQKTAGFIAHVDAKPVVVIDNCVNNGAITRTCGHGKEAGDCSDCGSLGGAGFVANTTNDCHVTIKNSVNNGSVYGMGTMAGFAGYAMGDIVLENCTNNGRIEVTNKITYLSSAAGLVGIFGNGGGNHVLTIKGCTNNSDIYLGAANYEGAGGMVGSAKWNNATEIYFEDCVNAGDICNKNAGGNYGGFLGWADAIGTVSFKNCTNYGNISGNGNNGGFLGQVGAKKVMHAENCVNYGDITSNNNMPGGFSGWCNGSDGCAVTIDGFTNYGVITAGAKQASACMAANDKAASISIKNVTNYGHINGKTGAAVAIAAGSKAVCENLVNNGMMTGEKIIGEITNNGSFGEVIEVNNAEDFMAMKPGFNYILMNNIVLPEDYWGGTFGSEWYTCELDGNGKTIYMKGLKSALFQIFHNVYVHDLKIVGTLNAKAALAGEISNFASDVTISNVVIDVDITNNARAGGFIEWHRQNVADDARDDNVVYNVTFNNCAFLGNITTTGGNRTGGFIAEWAFVNDVNLTFNNCVVGDRGLDTAIKGNDGRVSGFVGKFQGNSKTDNAKIVFNNCVNYADVAHTGTTNEGASGGFGGRFVNCTATLNNCDNYGDVSSNRGTGWIQGLGGLVGEVNRNAYITIDGCNNYGNVYAKRSVVGGLLGAVTNASKATIKNSANFGNVENGAEWNFYAGGIVGSTNNSNAGMWTNYANEIVVDNCQNYGTVTTQNANTGGVVGGIEGAGNTALLSVTNCANYGTITINGGNNVGGIIGQGVAGGTTIVENNVNYGYIAGATSNHAVGGIMAYPYAETSELIVKNNANYGIVEGGAGSNVAGITADTNAKKYTYEGNVNYGTIIGVKENTAGVCGIINDRADSTFAANYNYGIIIAAKANLLGPAVPASVKAEGNYAGGVVVTNADNQALVKALASPYNYDVMGAGRDAWMDLVKALAAAEGVEIPDEPVVEPELATSPVDFTTLDYIIRDWKSKEAVSQDDYNVLFTNTITADTFASASADGNTNDDKDSNAKAYYAKLLPITEDSYYELTFKAKNNRNGGYCGFVFAADAENHPWFVYGGISNYGDDDQTKSDLRARYRYHNDDGSIGSQLSSAKVQLALDLDDAGFASYKVVYEGLTATVYALVGGEWVHVVFGDMEAFTLTEGSSVAIGVYNRHGLTQQRTATLTDAALTAPAAAPVALAAEGVLTVEEAIAALLNKTALNEAKVELAAMGDVAEDDAKAVALKAAIEAMEKATTQAELDKAATELEETNKTYVDLSNLNYQLAQAEQYIQTNYTKATWVVFAEALEAAKAVDVTDQAAVDAAAAALDAAIYGLADISELTNLTQKAIAAAEALIEENYGSAGWKVMLEKLAVAKQAFADLDTELMDTAVVELNAAINALISVEELKALIAELSAIDPADYSVVSYAPVASAVTIGLTTTDPVDQAPVDVALALLRAAKAGLVNVSELNAAIAEAEKTNASRYTEASYAKLLNVLASAKLVVVSADDAAEVADAKAAVEAAVKALRRKTTISTKELEALIADAEAIDGTLYTAESWDAFKAALAAAKVAVYADTQGKVRDAQTALEEAMSALVEKPVISTDALAALIAEVEALDFTKYTTETWSAVSAALIEAKVALKADDQAVVDAAKAALDAAKAALAEKPVIEIPVEPEKPTEPEQPTEQPTEKPTEKPTDVAKNEGGCGGAIGATVVVMTAVLGLGATVVLKKKED